MGSVPLLALAGRGESDGGAQGIRNALGVQLYRQNAALAPGQQQIQQQTIEDNQQKLNDQQAMTAAMQQWDGKDPNELPGLILKNHGSAQAVFGTKNQILSQQKMLNEADDATLTNLAKKNDIQLGKLNTLQGLPDDQLPQAVQALAQDGLQNKYLDPPHAQGLLRLAQQGPDAIKAQLPILEKQLQGGAAQFANQIKLRETAATEQKDAADAAKANAEAAAKQAETEFYKNNGGAPGVPAETMQMGAFLKNNPGKTAADYPAWKAAQVGQAELPQKLYLAKADAMMKQTVADGDPNSAAQLLVSGLVAPSQLISSRKPAFAQQAFSAARQLDPTWNAQKADADFKVAQSPTQVAFFGSAKSLTDKGGTLDQLAEAAKAIPGGKIPVFNSIADAYQAATGSGPIAKYASLLVGVADDYSKVMGGGTGSDASRAQGFKLAAAAASPEQRAASIEGMRGAVGSQINSRIGKNPVLRQMYAPDSSGGAGGYTPPAGAPTAVGANGHKIVVDGGKWVDAQTGKPI